jgi:hypothetical protein
VRCEVSPGNERGLPGYRIHGWMAGAWWGHGIGKQRIESIWPGLFADLAFLTAPLQILLVDLSMALVAE